MRFGAGTAKGIAKMGGGAGGVSTLSDNTEAMGVVEGKVADTAICIRGESQKRGEAPSVSHREVTK